MPAPATYEDLSRLIDLSLLKPELTDDHVVEGLNLARRYGIGGVTVRSCDIDLAVRVLQGSDVRAGAVCGFPHGTQNTAAKLYEGRDLLRRGAKAIEMVIGIPKLLSREFQYVQTELLQISESCHKEGALFTVIFENAFLTEELKIIACRCCERAEVDFVATSTGFAATGYTADDVRLMRKHVPEEIAVKAGGIHTLELALEALAAGAGRIGTDRAAAILDEWKARLEANSTPQGPAVS